ncbi:MAG: sigma-70 family RNA polymerase sigma factor [Bacteroidales bacterium]|nr:sigma-70 family RNA polymerase sigma factor [Bacteroidales bacterium]
MPLFKKNQFDQFIKKESPKNIAFLKFNFPGLRVEEIEDIVQDSNIILYNNIFDGKYQHKENVSLSNYFFKICKNQTQNAIREKKRFTFEPFDENQEPSYSDTNINYLLEEVNHYDQMISALKPVIKQMPSPCDDILIGFYWHHFSMKEIAEREGYKNEDVAKAKKSKCLSKFKSKFTEICKDNKWTLTI